MKVTLLSNIQHDDKTFVAGDSVEVSEELGERWLNAGAAELFDDTKPTEDTTNPLVQPPVAVTEPQAPNPTVPTPAGTTVDQIQQDLAATEALSTLPSDGQQN
jgi:hypothetical protein